MILMWEEKDKDFILSSLSLYNFFLDQGILLRPLGNILYIMPPYCISTEELNYVYLKIEEALEQF